MQKVRWHNDIKIDWSITRCGAPEDFSERDVKVHLRHAYGEDAKITYQIEDNVVHIMFYGMDQRKLGQYMLILTENEGKPDMAEVDHCEAIELVAHSQDEGGSGCSNIEVNHISLRSDVEVPAAGASAYEIAVRWGFVGSEEEWLKSLKGDKGVTFVPSVSPSGDLSWSNDGDLPNPPTVNVKGGGGGADPNVYATINWVKAQGYLTAIPPEYVTATELADYNFATSGEVSELLKGYALRSSIPTTTSQLVNDSGFLTEHQSLTGLATEAWVGQQGYLTSVPSEYVTETELADYHFVTDLDIADMETKTHASNTYQSKGDYALKSEIPSVKGLATEAWVGQQGYLTEHQDISGKLDSSVYKEDKLTFATKGEIGDINTILDKINGEVV